MFIEKILKRALGAETSRFFFDFFGRENHIHKK